jgi:hypothetical protein
VPDEFGFFKLNWNISKTEADPNYEPEPEELETDDLMTVDEFVNCCKAGGFIDDDGIGYYSDKDRNYKEGNHVSPSEVVRDCNINRNYTHVLWFNR